MAFSIPPKLGRSPPSDQSGATIRRFRRRSSPMAAAANEVASQQTLAVAIDQPLVFFDRMSPVSGHSVTQTTKVPAFPVDWQAISKAMSGIMTSRVFRIYLAFAAVSFCLLLVVFTLSKSTKGFARESPLAVPGIAYHAKAIAWLRSNLTAIVVLASNQLQRLRERFKRQPETKGTPMPFDSESGNEGWGVCTLRSKRRLGRSSFVQYEFDLPASDYFLPLDLGQQVSLCCLDSANIVAKAEFFPYSMEDKKRLGSFAILAPNKTPPENEFAIGDDAANFVRVLKQDLKVGDEVALKPGKNRLEYRGQYLPVTDMLYIACGTGIVPVMNQVRMVLSLRSASSVESVTVVWINESTRDFDTTAEQLEKEYHKYSTKLAVSCIVDDLTKVASAMKQNPEIVEAVPDFIPGTMAVLSGPLLIMRKAAEYLQGRGYPLDCMCLL